MDNERLIEFAKKFRMLEKIALESNIYCRNKSITDSGIERMVNEAKYLKYLHLWDWVPNVTRDFVERMRMENPDLVIRINND